MIFFNNMKLFRVNYIHRLLFFTLLVAHPMLYTKVTGNGKKNGLKVSLIIPCHPKHAVHLYDLLKWYEHQTVLPDEVVISLSEAGSVSEDIFDKLKRNFWAFPVTLICSRGVLYAGQNRNLACRHAIGDIFLTQDADDLAHHQRVAVVKYFFERYKLDFLMHLLRGVTRNEKIEMDMCTDFDTIEFVNPASHRNAWRIRALTNGNIAIARHVFEKFQWPTDRRAQDVKYNRMIFAHFKNRLVVKIILQYYRNYLSTKELTNIKLNKRSKASISENKKSERGKFLIKIIMNNDSSSAIV